MAGTELRVLVTAQDEASPKLNKVSSGLGRLSKVAFGVSAAIAGVSATFVGMSIVLKKFLNTYAVTEKSMIRLQTAFGDSAREVERYSGALEMELGIEDAVLRNIATDLKVRGLQNKYMEQGVKVTVALAHALGVDYTVAATMVARATNGNVMQLQRLGFQIDEAAVKSKDAGRILDDIGQRTLPFLHDKVEGVAGRLNLWSIAMGNVKESTGRAIAGTATFNILLTELTKSAKVNDKIFIALSKTLDALTRAALTVVKGLSYVFVGLSEIYERARWLFKTLQILSTQAKLKILTAKFESQIKTLEKAFQKGKISVEEYDEQMQKFQQSYDESHKKFEAYLLDLEVARSKGLSANEDFINSLLKFSDRITELKQRIRDYDYSQTQTFEKGAEKVKKYFNVLDENIDKTTEKFVELKKSAEPVLDEAWKTPTLTGAALETQTSVAFIDVIIPPEIIARINTLVNTFSRWADSFKPIERGMDVLDNSIYVLGEGISTQLIEGTYEWGDAFKRVGEQILAMLIQIGIKAAILGTVSAATGIPFFGLLGFKKGGLIPSSGEIPRAHAGTYIGGDEHLIIGHTGEYVTRAEAVANIGRRTFDYMNATGRLPRTGEMYQTNLTFHINTLDGADVERVVRSKIIPVLRRESRRNVMIINSRGVRN